MKRDIVVNGRFLSRRVTGVERYGSEILPGFRDSCRVETTRVHGWAGHAWEQFILPAKLKPGSVLWSPANTGPLWVSDQALTIHDLSPLEHPEWFQKKFAAWYRLFLPALTKRVRVVFTPSQHVKQKIINRFGIQNVIVTPNAVNTTRFHANAKQKMHVLPAGYILFVGSLQPRKNVQALLRAWLTLKDEFKDLWLVIAGDTGTVFEKTNLLTDERVRFLGYVPEDDLPGLYAQATLFVLPSFDEGCGLPVLEAMACGAPVVVSNGGALPETTGDAGLVFDLSKSDDLLNAIRECLTNKNLRSTLQEKGFTRVQGFSWQQTAELIWSTLNEI